MLPTSMSVPRNLGGVVAKLAETPDGGAEVVAWSNGAWTPAPFSVAEISVAPPASDRLMAELGIPSEEGPSNSPLHSS